MVIEQNKVGVLSYSIHLEDERGELLEQATLSNPRTLLFGTGRLMKHFENKLLGLKSGDTFEFTLSPEESFGKHREDLVLEIPKSAFTHKGKLEPELLEIGKIIPMMDSDGNPFDGKVLSVDENKVKMDFNHPLAGKQLFSKGEVLNVREATEEELNPVVSGCGCGTPNDSCCGSGDAHNHEHHHNENDGCCSDSKHSHKSHHQNTCGC